MTPTSGLTVYRHETLPPLASVLADTIDETIEADPLTQTVVAVPSFAVARWLSDALATHHGGAYAHVANLATPFPATVIDAVLTAVLDDAASQLFTPDRLTWTILSLLRRDQSSEPAYTSLQQQLAPEAGERSGVAFARHTADLFDRYIKHRPELLDRWCDADDTDRFGQPLGPHLAWQPVLWRSLCAAISEDPPHVRLTKAITRLSGTDTSGFNERLAERYSVFGVHALPASELALLNAVSHHRPVNLYLLTPSRTWPLGSDPQPNNPSLDVFTRHAQTQHRQVAKALTNATVNDLDVPSNGTTALSVLKRHLLTDTPPKQSERAVLQPDDNSVSLHACHGIVRECDAVKDHLLALLDADPTLQLRDIAIISPDLPAIAPLIAGVLADGDELGQNRRNHPQLPFAIRDRSVATANPLAETLTQLLTLAQSRVTLNDVSDLLHREVVREQLGLTTAEIGDLVALLRTAGVRWGIDSKHRLALSGVADTTGSFAYGFDRIVLGLAVPNQGERVVYDVSPYAALATDDMQRFLTVLSFLTDVFAHLSTWREPRSLTTWIDATVQILDTLLKPPADAFQRQTDTDTIAQILGALANDTTEHASLTVSLAEYIDVFERACAKHGVTGTSDTGITVSSLLGIRSLPFRVVCLLGMNDTALANATSDVVHDLIATQPDPNDTSAKDETRQLVFDTLINATEHLIVTYTATDPRTGDNKPNARVLDDLIELIDTHLIGHDATSATSRLTVTHPRQLTHAAYYDPQSPLLRTDQALLHIAAAAQTRTFDGVGQPLVQPHLATPTAVQPQDSATLTSLISALQDPARAYLLRHGIRVVADEDMPNDRDLFALSGLPRYAVYDEAMSWRDDGTLDAFIDAFTSRGVLPTGSFGTIAKHELQAFVTDLRHVRRELADCPTLLPLTLAIDDVTLNGDVARYAHTIVSYDASSDPARSELAVWVQVLAVSAQTGIPHDGIVIYRNKNKLSIRNVNAPPKVDGCVDILTRLIKTSQAITTTPTPFFVRTSYAYAEKICAGKDVSKAVNAAQGKWHDAYRRMGEATKPAVRYLYGFDLPLDQLMADGRFHVLATDVFGPLFEARSQARA
ncbi:MAG: exodeoxyribonuclease V subunit gamma [Nitriliruptoraceae bacterium]